VEVEVLIRVLLTLVIAFVPGVVSAQSAWDSTGMAGLFAGRTPRSGDGSRYQDLWFHNVQGAAILGRHLTPHLKLELEASATGGGSQFRDRIVVVPGDPYPYPVGYEMTTSVRSIAAALTWQFRDNEWIHPFVQAGVSTDFDHVSTRTWEQYLFGQPRPGAPPQRIVEERIEEATTTHVRALLGAGAKFYFAPRGFVRSDARWTFDGSHSNIALRAGVGVDF
jgi:hypothetical protein